MLEPADERVRGEASDEDGVVGGEEGEERWERGVGGGEGVGGGVD